MKVLFIQPPIEDFYDTQIRTYPLGLLYLATKIKDLCEIKVLDLRKSKKAHKAENPFLELKEYYREDVRTPFSLFKRYSRYGAKDSEIKKLIESEKPDVLCLSSLFSAYSEETIAITRMAKEINGEIITIVGGHHPTSLPDLVLSEETVDFVIRGEGESLLSDLLSAIESKKIESLRDEAGFCFKENGRLYVSNRIAFEKEIDSIPDRSFIEAEDYRIGKMKYSFFITSRGCPYGCAFCSKMPVPYRKRSLRSIESEIEILKSMGIEWIDFEDDMLILEEERFLKILRLLKGKGFSLSAMNGVHINSLNRRIIKEMAEAGFRKLNISIVDISQSVLLAEKRIAPSNMDRILSEIETSELDMEVHFIAGLPSQTVSDVLKTMSYLSTKRCLIGVSVYYLSPLNPLVGEVLKESLKERLRYMRSSVLFPVSPSFSRKSLFTIMKLARFINSLKKFVDSKKVTVGLEDVRFEEPLDNEIFLTLIKEKRFVAYDTKKEEFFEEPQEKEIIEHFFCLMKGKKVKGYKTDHFVIF